MRTQVDRDDDLAIGRELERKDAEIERLRAAQWPNEATQEMKEAVFKLKLGDNRLSEDDVIDIYDTLRRIVSSMGLCPRTPSCPKR